MATVVGAALAVAAATSKAATLWQAQRLLASFGAYGLYCSYLDAACPGSVGFCYLTSHADCRTVQTVARGQSHRSLWRQPLVSTLRAGP